MKSMKELRAIAKITVDPQAGWNLPTFGSKKPFRYWAHVHFEKDPTWGQRTWTLLVDLDKDPAAYNGPVTATVYFMAQEAPTELLEEGARFELLCGKSHYGKGIIISLFEVEPNSGLSTS